jgi:DNA polymerase III alpha subunit
MQQNKFGEMLFNETDVCDLLMQGRSIESLKGMLVDSSVDIERVVEFVENFPDTIVYRKFDKFEEMSLPDWDSVQQQTWFMPKEYSQLDIAQYILNLCTNEPELQRCGEELLLYQERNLFSLLQYLKYLVDVMTQNQVIWGVGRGSSVASFVLYKLGVHKINSLYYNLDVHEFLR